MEIPTQVSLDPKCMLKTCALTLTPVNSEVAYNKKPLMHLFCVKPAEVGFIPLCRELLWETNLFLNYCLSLQFLDI